MSAGNTRLDRTFRFDSKFPSGGFSSSTDTCPQCGEGAMAYDASRGESRCCSCNTPLSTPQT